MRTNRLAGLVTVLLIASAAAGTTPWTSAQTSQGRGEQLGDSIDRFANRWMDANGVPGLSLAVTAGTRVLHLAGFGTAREGRPVTPGTQFLTSSLSKSFTSTAVMQLAEADRIDLDAPVRSYLPGFTVAQPHQAAKITVRMLLNQTSGMADAGFPEMTLPQPGTITERVASLRAARLVSQPGIQFHYFNPNYAILARLVEVVAGQPFGQYLREHIFAPLGMTGTASVVTTAALSSAVPRLAQGYILAFGIPVAHGEPKGYLGGSGGVISTAEDMASWLIAQNQGGVFRGHRLLSAQGIELMHTPPRAIDSSYAMGWERQRGTPRAVSHTGVLSSFYAEQALLPDGRYGIVCLANAYSGLIDFGGLMHGLAALVTGHENEPGAGFGARPIGFVLGGMMALTAAVGVWRLHRVRSWARMRRGRPWRAALGMAVPLVPATATLLAPMLAARLSGRVFGWWVLFLAVPDLMVCLLSAAVFGAAMSLTRAVFILRGGWAERVA